MTLFKLGRGVADEDVLAGVVERAGCPTMYEPPDCEKWRLEDVVRKLDFVPKNKPFLIGETEMPAITQSYLDACPSAAMNARWLLQAFYPCHDPRYPQFGNVTGGCYGCKTEDLVDFGHVYSSKTSLIGLVEGIVSSLANWKLYAYDLKHHSWTGELVNSKPSDWAAKYQHPLRMSEAATAGTVIHTQYCCAHLLEWYQHVLVTFPDTPGAVYRAGVCWERVERGMEQMKLVMSSATKDGMDLLDGLATWSQELLDHESAWEPNYTEDGK